MNSHIALIDKMNKFFLFVSFGLFVSCNHLRKSASADFSNVINIEYNTEKTREVKLDKLIDAFSYVKLETNANCLIGEIEQVVVLDSLIIISDPGIANSIYVFDINGKFRNRISRVGNAQNEYLDIQYVFVNSHNELGIVDNVKDAVLFFSLDGKFQRSVNNPYPNTGMDYVNGDTVAFFVANITSFPDKTANRSYFVIADDEYKPLYYLGEDPNYFYPEVHFQRGQNLYRYDDNLYCGLTFDNTIYRIGTSGVEAKYQLTLSPEKIYEMKMEDFETRDKFISKFEHFTTFSGGFIECKDFALFRYRFPENWQHPFRTVLYNRNNGTLVALADDVEAPELSYFYVPCNRYGDNTIVEAMSAVDVIRKRDALFGDGVPRDMEPLYDGLSVDSNPVLFFYNINMDRINE